MDNEPSNFNISFYHRATLLSLLGDFCASGSGIFKQSSFSRRYALFSLASQKLLSDLIINRATPLPD